MTTSTEEMFVTVKVKCPSGAPLVMVAVFSSASNLRKLSSVANGLTPTGAAGGAVTGWIVGARRLRLGANGTKQ